MFKILERTTKLLFGLGLRIIDKLRKNIKTKTKMQSDFKLYSFKPHSVGEALGHLPFYLYLFLRLFEREREHTWAHKQGQEQRGRIFKQTRHGAPSRDQ